jgi:transposase InsO family protein
VSLASTALSLARSQAAASLGKRHRLEVELDQATAEIALLKEELDIKDARWSRLPSRRRPFYSPIQRMRVLQLKAARGWSCAQTARSFLIDEQTLRSWLRRVDEEGERALIQISEPVNRFPDFVRYLVKQLKVLLPTMGKLRIAQVLTRAGLHLGATTVGRILRETELIREDAAGAFIGIDAAERRVVRAKYSGHVMHVDLTAVPTWAGFWVPWAPHAWPQSWPFCWWIAVALDHFSRVVVGFGVFFKRPTSAEIQSFLDRAIRVAGGPPKYVIVDKGCQFWCDSFKRWCRRRGIRPRFGAVGKYGSIATVERFIRALKGECTRRILVPLLLDGMRREISLYVGWYNGHRPNQALGGRTPLEAYHGLRPANMNPRFEPREKWPPGGPCASPRVPVRGERGANLALVVTLVEGRRHLPIVELREAA